MQDLSGGTGIGLRRPAFAGLAASLVGIGLARFAYTPLIPALIGAGWFAPSAAAYLGAANLAGYLAGAVLAPPLARRIGAVTSLRAMMLTVVAAFFACATPLSFAWFFLWRFASGVGGGAIMVLAAAAILPQVPPARRGLVAGIIFTGVGLGVAASGSLVPLLLRLGLVATWCGLGVTAAAFTALAWHCWPPAPARTSAEGAKVRLSRPAKLLMLQYGLDAAGLVPHMVFLVDFVARGLGRGIAAGGAYWVIYGVGAMVGPLLAGRTADRIGFRPMLRIAFALQAVAVALPLAGTGAGWLVPSCLLAGGFTSGIVPLVAGRIQELAAGNSDHQRAGWAGATISFALFQAAAGYLYSYLFAATGGLYMLLFALGTGSLTLAFALDFLPRSHRS